MYEKQEPGTEIDSNKRTKHPSLQKRLKKKRTYENLHKKQLIQSKLWRIESQFIQPFYETYKMASGNLRFIK